MCKGRGGCAVTQMLPLTQIYSFIFRCSTFLINVVPSRAPRILEVFAKSPNSVFVKWEPIPQHHVKGLLQGYHVHYSQIDTSYPVLKNVITVNESVAHVTLDNMKPLTRYRVWITGFTKKGSGPSSDKTFVSTPQTGQ